MVYSRLSQEAFQGSRIIGRAGVYLQFMNMFCVSYCKDDRMLDISATVNYLYILCTRLRYVLKYDWT